MADYRLTLRAEEDLTGIYLFSRERFGELKAESYLLSLEECCERLASPPGLGQTIDQIRPGYLRFQHTSHSIFYRVIDEGLILIVRVLHQGIEPDLRLPG